MRLVYFGTPGFAVPPLKKLMEEGYDIAAVVTQPDRQSGRGRKMSACPVKAEAQQAGLKILQPDKVRSPDFIDELRKLNPDVIAVAAYGQILPPDIIHLPEHGCINIHASLLPKYRGAAPINWAVIRGEEKTGITTMLMDEGMDTGPVLLQEETPITQDDTAGSLSLRLSGIGAGLLITTLRELERGDLTPRPQTGEASYAPVLKKTDGLIDWTMPAKALCNFIRGVNPWPGAYSFLGGDRYRILRAAPVEDGGGPGTIKRVTTDELIVCAGGGGVSVLEIQPSGKPLMRVRDFLQGQGKKLSTGMQFSGGGA